MSDQSFSIPQSPARPATGFVHLGRGSKWLTRLKWCPAGFVAAPGKHPEAPQMTPDYSAVVASLDLADFPESLKPGQRVTVLLAGAINPIGYWAALSATPELCELFAVSAAAYYPPGYSGIPELTLTAKQQVSKKDIPDAAAYLFLLS